MPWKRETLQLNDDLYSFHVFRVLDPLSTIPIDIPIEDDSEVARLRLRLGDAALAMMVHYAFDDDTNIRIGNKLPNSGRLNGFEVFNRVAIALLTSYPIDNDRQWSGKWPIGKANADREGFRDALTTCSPHFPGLVNIICQPREFQYQVLCLGPPVASHDVILTPDDRARSQELLFLDPIFGIVIMPREFSSHGFLRYSTAIASRRASTSAVMFASEGLFLIG